MLPMLKNDSTKEETSETPESTSEKKVKFLNN
jgi:hypothetical protein